MCRLSRSDSEVGAAGRTNEELIRELKNLSTSTLEKEWLRYIIDQGLRLPDKAQTLLEDFNTRADFLYTAVPAAVFLDGPHHETPQAQEKDKEITSRLIDAGFTVVRIPRQKERWAEIVNEYGFVFRSLS